MFKIHLYNIVEQITYYIECAINIFYTLLYDSFIIMYLTIPYKYEDE